ERIPLVRGVVRPARDERLGQVDVRERATALEDERARVAVDRDDLPGPLPRRRVDRLLARPDLVLLRGEREREGPRLGDPLALADLLETGERVPVLEQLLVRAPDPVEDRPPDRLRLAAVVVEELARDRLARVDQRLSEGGALLRRGRRRLRLLGHDLRERTEPRERLVAALEQP